MKSLFKYKELTNTESIIMEQLWKLEKPSSLKEITAFLNTQLKKEWKQQTVGTYLSQLEKIGMIEVDKRFSKLHLYFPSYKKEDFFEMCAHKFVEQAFDNSLSSFMAAFTKAKKLSKKEADELIKLIHDYHDSL